MTGVRCVCAQVRALPKLRILVMGLLKSLSSIAYIGLLLGLLFYLYVAPLAGTFYGRHSHGSGRGPLAVRAQLRSSRRVRVREERPHPHGHPSYRLSYAVSLCDAGGLD